AAGARRAGWRQRHPAGADSRRAACGTATTDRHEAQAERQRRQPDRRRTQMHAPGRLHRVGRRHAARSTRDAALVLLDAVVIDAGVASAHQTALVELPMLVSVAAPPLTVVVVTLVLETHRDAIVGERPQLLAQPVLLLA